MRKLFGPDNPGNRNGRAKGTKNWWTEARDKLRQSLPDAIATLLDAVKAGDVPALKLYFSIVVPPTRATYPHLAIDFDNQSPQETLAAVKRALASGSISSDHAASILDVLAKVKRLETGILLAAREVQGATVLETFQSLATTAASMGDVDTLESAGKSVLPYLESRPQPEPPPASGTVSSEPVGLDGEDWEQVYGNPTGGNPV